MKGRQNFKHVFLITVDCLRADHVGCIGGGNLTPNIDRLAEDSLLFERAFANGPGTNQSFPAILTSTHFLMHGGMRLLPHYTTLAEVLSKNGFRTVAFHSNPFLSKALGWSRGFSDFYDFMDVIKSPSAEVTRSGRMATVIKGINRLGILDNKRLHSILRRAYYHRSAFEIPYVEGAILNRHVIRWTTENRDEPLFMWIHYMDAHRPYVPPSRFLKDFATRKESFMFDASVDKRISDGSLSSDELRKLKRLYEGEVEYVDECVGQLRDFLESQGLLENSLLILSADHGEAFMEHNKVSHAYEIVYNEVIHVPLIIHGLTDCPKRFDKHVQLLDVPPTVLDALGLKRPTSFLGDTLLPRLNGNGEPLLIFSESAKPELINLRYDLTAKVVSCIFAGWKLIISDFSGTAELYDIQEDFSEQSNLVESEQKVYRELSSAIHKHLSFVNLRRRRMKLKGA